MNTFYKTTEYLKDTFKSNPDVNTIIFGKQNETDLYKKNIYSLVHIIPTGANYNTRTAVYSFRVISLDQRDISKSVQDDKYEGNDNQQDNLNLTDTILRHFILTLLNQHNDDSIDLVNYSEAKPLLLSNTNLLDGWYIDVTLQLPNQISVC